jgi:hypothetical protein
MADKRTKIKKTKYGISQKKNTLVEFRKKLYITEMILIEV